MGVKDPRRHIIVVKRNQKQQTADIPSAVATIIASRTPFSDEDLALAEKQCKQMQFDLMLTPKTSATPELADFAGSTDPFETAKKYPINLSPPTDDKPFFFNMTRMHDAFNPAKWEGRGHDVNLKAVQVVAGLLVFVILLTIVCVIVPVMIKADKAALKASVPLTRLFHVHRTGIYPRRDQPDAAADHSARASDLFAFGGAFRAAGFKRHRQLSDQRRQGPGDR